MKHFYKINLVEIRVINLTGIFFMPNLLIERSFIMENLLIFTGYKSGIGKSKKQYYMLSFITPPVVSQDQSFAYSNSITLFTTEEKYNKFVKEHGLMDNVNVSFEVNGDKVRYYL